MRYLIAVLLATTAGQACAQDTGWSYKITPYLWLPDTTIGVDTPRGSVSAELSIGDALKELDFAFMGAFEANKGKWSLVTDILYFNLSATASTPFGALFDEAIVSSKITAFSALAAYRIHEDANLSVDIGAGVRAWSVSSEVLLRGGALPPEDSTTQDDWIDPIVAVRGRIDFDEKWFGTFYFDAGGFGVGSDHSYQAIAGVGYNLNDKWSLLGGWRYLDFEREKDGNQLDFKESGLVLGASYRF
jgi:opacity protein-like surface antigen